MAESILYDIVGRLVGNLSQSVVEGIAPYFGGRKKLKKLHLTMEQIQARLSDAERLQEEKGTESIKMWLKSLKGVMYRLEDLFEEVAVADKLKDQRDAKNLPKLVCCLPSKLRSLKINKLVAQEAQEIMADLDFLKENMVSLQLGEVNVAANQSPRDMIHREETDSLIIEENIIGRDEDKETIIQMLVDSDFEKKHLSVIPIVGMGGLGKTTLARLVFNDQIVQQYFELKYWACISDQISSFEELVGKVHESITEKKTHSSRIKELQSDIVEAINGRKFLLVLDDVWDEDCENWRKLKGLLCRGKPGSKILVTSRSEVVALNMGTVEPYTLKGLPEDKSWALFKALAFRQGQEVTNPNLTIIGRDIVRKCGNVPLAIRTIAGILYSRNTEEEWVYFRDREIGRIDQKGNYIVPTLKLSYNHLPPQLKQCFAYCSLFPEDHEFDIEKLIWLWIAQGFIILQNNESPYHTGHSYFMELLRRCFFQDVQRDSYGRMVHCKMHDLMHELAKKVGDECLLVDVVRHGLEPHINDNIRHVLLTTCLMFDSVSQAESLLFDSSQMQSVRTYIKLGRWDFETLDPPHLFSRLRRLRALDLGEETYKSLPDSVGELIHLRYLRARVSNLPEGITRLQNLETLDLRGSEDLTELPSGFYNLTTLRQLRLKNGYFLHEIINLIDMPPKFGQLKSLEMLDSFIVGENNGVDALFGLKLIGDLTIYFKKYHQNDTSDAKNVYLKDSRLIRLYLDWPCEYIDESGNELLERLHPPPTLKFLRISGWQGVRLPSWGMDEFHRLLPNLVEVHLTWCSNLQNLPSLSRLLHLKVLDLTGLNALEYLAVRGESSSSGASSSACSTTYFPCLEILRLRRCMDILKGWLKMECADSDGQIQDCQHLRFFPCLKQLTISARCPELNLWDVRDDDGEHGDRGMGNSVSCSDWQYLKSLCFLTLDNISHLESIPSGIGGLTALQQLGLEYLHNLKTLPEFIGNLTALQCLYISNCKELAMRCKPDGEDWPLIQHIPNIKIDNEYGMTSGLYFSLMGSPSNISAELFVLCFS